MFEIEECRRFNLVCNSTTTCLFVCLFVKINWSCLIFYAPYLKEVWMWISWVIHISLFYCKATIRSVKKLINEERFSHLLFVLAYFCLFTLLEKEKFEDYHFSTMKSRLIFFFFFSNILLDGYLRFFCYVRGNRNFQSIGRLNISLIEHRSCIWVVSRLHIWAN